MKLSTTTFNDVTECGLVSSSCVYGIGLITYIVYSFCCLFGCSSKMMSDKIDMAKMDATSDIKRQAREMNADGIMGLRYQISFLSVLVYGTAFKYNNEEISDTSLTNKNSSNSPKTHKKLDNKDIKISVPENAQTHITERNTIICSFCNFEQPINRKVCWHCGATFTSENNGSDITTPYWCGTCKKAGPFDGDCPSCGSSIKKFNILAK